MYLKHYYSLCYSLIYPYLTHGICAWGSTIVNYLKPIEIQQKFALRIISQTIPDSTHPHCSNILKFSQHAEHPYILLCMFYIQDTQYKW